MGRVARLLEPVGLGRDDGIDEAELVDDENPAAGARHPRELGDDQLRPASVMEDAHAPGDVERAVRERQRRCISDDQLAVRRRELVAGLDELGREIDPDDAPDERRQREGESPGATAAVERALGPRERREQLLHAIPQPIGALLLHRDAISHAVTHRRPLASLGLPARRSRRLSRTGSCLKSRACSSIRTPSPISVTGSPAPAASGRTTASASIETVPTTRARSPATTISVPRHVAPEAVGIADRDDADPQVVSARRSVVRSRCSRRRGAIFTSATEDSQRERRPQAVRGGVGAEGRDAVDGDPAANGVEMSSRVAQGAGAVRDMARQVRIRRRRREEPLELQLR